MIRAISTQLEHDSGTYLSLMLDERVFCEAPLIINYKTALLCFHRDSLEGLRVAPPPNTTIENLTCRNVY